MQKMQTSKLGLLLGVLASVASIASASSRVLFIITPGPQSHMYGMQKIAKELASRNQTLLLLAADKEAEKLRSTGIPILQFSAPTFLGGLKLQGSQSLSASIVMASKGVAAACVAVTSNSTIMAKLQEFQADVMVATTFNPCTQVLASKLDKPFINFFPAGPIDPMLTSIYPNSNRRALAPNPLSYVPQAGHTAATQHMTYFQRLENLGRYLLFVSADFFQLRPFLKSFYASYGLDLSHPREARRLIMHIFSADFALEWPRPLPPNLRLVGPLLPEPAQPLPAELEAFVGSAGDAGVLYVAMGTIATLGLVERQAMASAFAAMPAKVLWRLSPSEVPDKASLAELGIGNNTKVVTWAPQNDVLGHPRVKAFLSHCGANSMYEAAYHGVPITGLPFFAEQPNNAAKIVAKGMGLRIRHRDIGTPAFGQAIRKVLEEPGYRAAAARVSRMLRARRQTPVQEAADWVEHVLATDAEPYLRTPEEELSFIVRHNLDVNAAVAVSAFAMLALVWRALRAASRLLSRRSLKLKPS